jgi:hypothetical protein
MENIILTKIHAIYKNCFNHLLVIKTLVTLGFILYVPLASAADSYISSKGGPGLFPLVAEGKSAPLCVSSQDYPGVLKIVKHLQADIERVTGIPPKIIKDKAAGSAIVIIGTIGRSPLIDTLSRDKKINVGEVAGRWDTYALQTVENPLPGVDRALVIFGSDKRGTIFGIYDLSSRIGVSPWYWWADTPVQKKGDLYVKPGFHSPGEPKVKYRGLFINDEAPALRNWAQEKFGGFNHKFYEKVFELILRNKGNFLWPAMWPPSAFFADDAENPRLADELGVVIATSHHEPLMRAHDEWRREGRGAWNYETNAEELRKFWRGGIERMGDYESVVTIGMRGDGDQAMSEETAISLLEKIVSDQRKIIAEVTGKPAQETPQVWALYKEVQDYYDKGMRVPDDVTILLCDDNWGNIRILPKKEDLGHQGGFGIYYHFDFVGGPISYRWLNVTQIERVWEQMNLSYEWGVRKLWLVNVGDIKPMELPVSFFLDFAWNPEAINAEDLQQYYVNWAKQQFGDHYAVDIAEILSLYTKYNARRTPEMLKPDTYSLVDYREADTIVADYRRLAEKARRIYDNLPESHRSAFYQLVLFPVESCSNLNEMYVAAGKNKVYGEQGRASANYFADKVKELFDQDAVLTHYYHQKLANGKWNHMMSQTHIGYTYWNNPPANKMPAVAYLHIRKSAGLGYVIEKSTGPGFTGQSEGLFGNELPRFDPINNQNFYVEIFNMGSEKLSYTIEPKDKWIKLSSAKGNIKFDEKVYVSIDWPKAPKGQATGEIVISGAGNEYVVRVPIRNDLAEAYGFVENNGAVSIESAHFTRAVDSKEISWTVVPNLGRTLSSVMVEPVNADRQVPGDNTPRLEYEFTVFSESALKIDAYLSPTLNYQKNDGLQYAIAVDDEEPKIINIHEGENKPDWEYPEWWNISVTDHIRKKRSVHKIDKPGRHTLKVWMVDPGVVFQKFVIDAGGLKPSYLGPPESIYLEPSSGKQ